MESPQCKDSKLMEMARDLYLSTGVIAYLAHRQIEWSSGLQEGMEHLYSP